MSSPQGLAFVARMKDRFEETQVGEECAPSLSDLPSLPPALAVV